MRLMTGIAALLVIVGTSSRGDAGGKVAILVQPKHNVIGEVPAPQKAPAATEVALLYAKVGRELKAVTTTHGLDTTIDLWPRYRWIRINEAIATPGKRAEASLLLQDLQERIRAL